MKLRKQHILIALAALAMMPGCNKFKFIADDMGDGHPTDDVPQSELQVISFGVKTTDVDVTTKSVGSVDEWAAHQLYIYGYNNIENNFELNNVPVLAPASGGSGMITPEDTSIGDKFYYNPNNHTYDFWGYYVDDAFKVNDSSGEKPNPTVDNQTVTLPVRINGSQDIMLAFADKSADIVGSITEDKLYSAYSARRNIVPTLTFEHQLAKFNIFLKSGSAEGDNVLMTKVTVEGDEYGTLTIVGTDRGLVPTTSDPKAVFTLKDATLEDGKCVELKEVAPEKGTLSGEVWTKPTTYKEIGAGFLLFPGESEYEIVMHFKHGMQTSEMPITLRASDVVVESDPSLTITEFEKGKEYDINVIIYGLEKIEINAQLKEWATGGEINYDPDNVWGVLSYKTIEATAKTITVSTSPGQGQPEVGDEVKIDGAAVTVASTIIVTDGYHNYLLSISAEGKVESWTLIVADFEDGSVAGITSDTSGGILKVTVPGDATTTKFKYILKTDSGVPVAYDFNSQTSYNAGSPVTIDGAANGNTLYFEVTTTTGTVTSVKYYKGIVTL